MIDAKTVAEAHACTWAHRCCLRHTWRLTESQQVARSSHAGAGVVSTASSADAAAMAPNRPPISSALVRRSSMSNSWLWGDTSTDQHKGGHNCDSGAPKWCWWPRARTCCQDCDRSSLASPRDVGWERGRARAKGGRVRWRELDCRLKSGSSDPSAFGRSVSHCIDAHATAACRSASDSSMAVCGDMSSAAGIIMRRCGANRSLALDSGTRSQARS